MVWKTSTNPSAFILSMAVLRAQNAPVRPMPALCVVCVCGWVGGCGCECVGGWVGVGVNVCEWVEGDMKAILLTYAKVEASYNKEAVKAHNRVAKLYQIPRPTVTQVNVDLVKMVPMNNPWQGARVRERKHKRWWSHDQTNQTSFYGPLNPLALNVAVQNVSGTVHSSSSITHLPTHTHTPILPHTNSLHSFTPSHTCSG